MSSTLQHCLRLWRAQFGAEREGYFVQEHPPGRQGLSDFTGADELKVEFDGAMFPHLLYQFALAYCGWLHVSAIDSGEGFMALSTSLQAALWALSGAPEREERCINSLPASFNNPAEPEELTRPYQDLCRHYVLRATRCNPGQSNERLHRIASRPA